jgi:two-component system phosphate regulon sensor histidine kinase PhoR
MNEELSRLAMLIGERRDDIITQWKIAACQLPKAKELDEPLLLDHMPQLLEELSSALFEAQRLSIVEMREQSNAAEHGAIRFRLGFDVEEVIAEFGILRDIIQRFAEAQLVNISGEVNRTANRVVDKAIASSLETYVRQQAEEVERKRQEYLSFIVHDLKTPISAMATAAQIIDQSVGSELQGSLVARKMLDVLRRNATRLNRRVMEILNEESRLHALIAEQPELRLDIHDVDLWPIAEQLKNDCQSIAESRKTTIRNEVPLDLRMSADPDLLIELLQNLVSNALKHTLNGEVIIGGEDHGDSVVCFVRDTGVGIHPEQIDRILQERPANPNDPESTGLGLAIVQKVMQLHKGSIAVQSTPGYGTTFRMKFTKARDQAA